MTDSSLPPGTAGAPSGDPGVVPLLSHRAVTILLVAVVLGIVVGCLTYLHTPSVPAAVLAGLGSAGAVVLALHLLMGHDDRRPPRGGS